MSSGPASTKNAKIGDAIDEMDEDEAIEEFIKKHLESDDKKQRDSGGDEFDENDEDENSDDDDNSSQGGLTPRQSLLQALLKLSETDSDGTPSTYSSLNERELFIFDLESILKVLTFKETCLLIFPCLEIFAVEQEYLKIELFKQLPHLFAKVMKTDAKINGQRLSDDQLMDILTVNLFPLISQLLMISDETVQQEGINAMIKVCKESIIPLEDGCFLMHNVL